MGLLDYIFSKSKPLIGDALLPDRADGDWGAPREAAAPTDWGTWLEVDEPAPDAPSPDELPPSPTVELLGKVPIPPSRAQRMDWLTVLRRYAEHLTDEELSILRQQL